MAKGELIWNNSPEEVKKASRLLLKAKEQEKKKIDNGYKYISLNDNKNTKILKRC